MSTVMNDSWLGYGSAGLFLFSFAAADRANCAAKCPAVFLETPEIFVIFVHPIGAAGVAGCICVSSWKLQKVEIGL